MTARLQILPRLPQDYTGELWRRHQRACLNLKQHVRAKSLQPCLTICDSMDHNPPGSSVHGILEAGILERVTMSSSWGSAQPRDLARVSRLLHWQVGSLPLAPSGKPLKQHNMCKSILHNDTLSLSHYQHGLCYDFTSPFFQGGDKNEGSELGPVGLDFQPCPPVAG